MKRFLLLLSFLLIGIVQTFAHDFEVDGIYYNILSGTTNVEVTRNDNQNNSYSGSVTIPSSVSYSGTTYSVTSIEDDAFRGCFGLTSVVIPSSVTSIGNYAFLFCSGLTSVVIPSSVTSIGSYAFGGCSSLASISVDAANTVYDSRNNCNAIIKKSNNQLVAGCKNTIIPSSVTSIGDNAFYDCSGLTSVVIPSSVTSIGDVAFGGCYSLASISVDAANTVYDSRNNCNAIIEKSNNQLVAGCKNTIIPSSVTSIGNYAFYGCSSLTSVVLPSSVTSIGYFTFSYCSDLTSVVIPSSVTSIGNGAFSYCSGLTSVTMLCPPPSDFQSASISSAATIYVTHDNYDAYTALGLPNRIEVATDKDLYDNILYLPDLELPQGASATLSLKMKNNVSISGFQFDLQLPEGVTIPNGSNGKPYIEVSTSRTTTSKHKVYCNPQPDGTLRVVCASLGNDTFSGTDGAVLNIHVNVASNTALGTHDVVLTHLELTEANNTQHKVARVQYPVTVTAGSYTITAISANTTMGTVSGGGTYTHGATVTLTATPKTGYDFVQWSDGTTANPYTFTATANKSVTAQFQACGLHNWTSTNKADNSTSSHTYNINYSAGQKLSFDWSVSSESNYDWLKVTIDGTEVLKKSGTASGNYSKPFATSGTAVLVVSYTKDNSNSNGSDEGKIYNLTLADYYLTITATSANTNQGTVSGGGSKKYGTSVTLTATPKTGYEFVQWSDGTTANPYTFTATADKSVTAQFQATATLGDVNNDSKITAIDVVGAVNLILNTNTTGLVRAAADVNRDGSVTVADATGIINLALGLPLTASSNQRRVLAADSEARLAIEAFRLTPGADEFVPVVLCAEADEFTALQFDVLIPEGIHLTDVLCDDDHTAAFALQADGKMRIVVLSPDNVPFAGNGLAALTLQLAADADAAPGTIAVDTIEVARPDMSRVAPSAFSAAFGFAGPTGIESVESTNYSPLYDIQGRRTIGAGHGIYVTQGRKVVK